MQIEQWTSQVFLCVILLQVGKMSKKVSMKYCVLCTNCTSFVVTSYINTWGKCVYETRKINLSPFHPIHYWVSIQYNGMKFTRCIMTTKKEKVFMKNRNNVFKVILAQQSFHRHSCMHPASSLLTHRGPWYTTQHWHWQQIYTKISIKHNNIRMCPLHSTENHHQQPRHNSQLFFSPHTHIT